MLRRSLGVLAALLVGVILFVICAEVYSRARYKDSYLSGLLGSDPVFHHLPPPYYAGTMQSEGDFDVPFRTNNRGMRGPGDYAYAKPAGVYRIAVLGDSFTFGVGVTAEETASSVLAGLLERDAPGAYQVYNFGVNSFSPLLEYLYLTQEVSRYRPDLVILMLDLCDVQDDYLYEPHIVRGPDGSIRGCDPLRRGGRPDLYALLMKYSRFVARLDTKLIDSFRKMRAIGIGAYLGNKLSGKRNKVDIVTDLAIDNIYFDRFLFSREGKDPAVVLRHWARTEGYLEMIARYLKKEGIRFILVVYPYGHQVGAAEWRIGRRYWGFEEGRVYDPGRAVGLVGTFAAEHAIPLVPLVDVMRSHAGEKLYFDRDGHLTSRGQRLVAEAIYASPAFRQDAGIPWLSEEGAGHVERL